MKKKIIYLSFILVLVISLITLSSIYKSKDNKYKKEYNTISKGMAIMIKEKGATDYVQSNSKDIPKGNYVLNEEKTYCENNGKVTNYNSATGTVSLNFIGSDRCYLYFDYKKETIKLGSTELVVNSEPPDFSKVATTNEGMFAADDDYTATTGMKSYYFRGAVNNNWVKFGKEGDKDIYWRIIRINGDGSIRMIYTGTTAPTESTKVVMTGKGTQITINSTNTFAFNSSKNKAEYVGYQYIEGQQHGYGKCDGTNNASCTVNGNTVYNSTIKQKIDKWYAGTTLKDNPLVSQDQIFCNDRTASTSDVAYSNINYTTLTSWNSTGTQYYYYGARGRLYKSKSPILTCPTSSDKFTVGTSNGNGALTYPVGLITADEVAMAGGVFSSDNRSYYLYTNQYYWSGSPHSFNSDISNANEFHVYSRGYIAADYVTDNTNGVRPVISLSSKAKLTGDGTWNNVFEVEQKGYETILANNTVNETTPNFSKVTTASEKGLYAADDDYTATTGMKSYYFRGAVDNNWVKFGKDSSGNDIYWRIIRINGDGSIRMIYSGTTAPTSRTAIVMTGTGTQIEKSKFNNNMNKSEYVGYMYTEGKQHGNSTDSAIKTAIDNWYKTTTLETDSATKSLVADQIFCNDRSPSSTQTVAWTSTGGFNYGALGRLSNNKVPILTCPTASDKFTVNTSNGNGALTYPVGLITADEVAMAGGKYNANNTTYYLYTNQTYWLGSSFRFLSDAEYGNRALGTSVDSSGNMYNYLNEVNYSYGVRPVVSLSSKAKLLGNGTYNDVYTVVGGNSTEDTSSGKSFDTVFAANNTDIFNENGLRYEGADPNNYICLDNKPSGACSSSSLLFRIIGLFDEDTSSNGTSSSGTKKLLKVIDTNNYGEKYWDSSNTNNWSKSTLQVELNDTYLTNLTNTANVNSKLTSAIANAKWHLGGASSSNYKTLTADGMYTEERNTSAIFNKNPSSIFAKVGIMYPSDYGYATVGGTTTNRSGCRAIALMSYDTEDCKNNDWLYTSQITSWGSNAGEWFLSPYSSDKNLVARLKSSGSVSLPGQSLGIGYYKDSVRPTFYLDSSVLKIVGTGDGTSSNPYRIG